MMKKINYAFVRAICALLAGLVLVLFPNEAGNYLVITVGALFLIPSLFTLIGYYVQRKDYPAYFPIDSVGGILFGLLLMVVPGFFLLLGGIQQISMLIAARHWSEVPFSYFIVPSLVLLAGIYAVMNSNGARNTAFIIIGVTFIIYALFELVNWFKFTRRRPKLEELKDVKPFDKDDADIEDAQIVEDNGTE